MRQLTGLSLVTVAASVLSGCGEPEAVTASRYQAVQSACIAVELQSETAEELATLIVDEVLGVPVLDSAAAAEASGDVRRVLGERLEHLRSLVRVRLYEDSAAYHASTAADSLRYGQQAEDISIAELLSSLPWVSARAVEIRNDTLSPCTHPALDSVDAHVHRELRR